MLIVEDEMILAFALRQQLEVRGCTVLRSVTNGQAGLASCCADRPDIVLMDIRMPVMDGLEATRRIMADCPACVVVMTAYGDADTASRAEEAGAMAYLTKPVDAARILEAAESAQVRFAEFMVVREEAAGHQEALAAWHLVQQARRTLMAREEVSEADAFGRLQCLASEAHHTLRQQAAQVLDPGPGSPN